MSRIPASKSDPLEFDRLVRNALQRMHDIVSEIIHFRCSSGVEEQRSEEANAIIFKRRNEFIRLLQRIHLSIEVINSNHLQEALHWLHSGLHWHYADHRIAHEHFGNACSSAAAGFTASVTLPAQLMASRIRLLAVFLRHQLIDFSVPLEAIGDDGLNHAELRFADSSSSAMGGGDGNGDFDISVDISNVRSNAQLMLQQCRTILVELCSTTAMKTAIADDQQKKIVFRRRHSEALMHFERREFVAEAAQLCTCLERLFLYSLPVRHLIQARHEEVLPREHILRRIPGAAHRTVYSSSHYLISFAADYTY